MVRRAVFAGGKTGRANPRSINAILTDYKRFVNVVETESQRILQTAAEMVLDATLPKVAVDTGALRASGKAEVVSTDKGFAAKVSFGGDQNPVSPTKNAPTGIVDYAILLHEDVEGYTSGKYKSGEPFYLLKGAQESRDQVESFIMSELRKIKP